MQYLIVMAILTLHKELNSAVDQKETVDRIDCQRQE